MRVVKEIPHSECRITIFWWNQKYLIKLEKGPFEQTFKVSEMDVLEDEIEGILTEQFVSEALQRFDEMFASLSRNMP